MQNISFFHIGITEYDKSSEYSIFLCLKYFIVLVTIHF